MSDTLVDSSAWVDFFRGEPAARRRVDGLLADGRAATCGTVFAEVTSGARTTQVFERLTLLLKGLDLLEPPQDCWEQVARARFTLARQGVQAHLVDLLIAATAAHHGHALLTRDRDFKHISRVLAVDVVLF